MDWAFFPVFWAVTQAEAPLLLQYRFTDPLAVHLLSPGPFDGILLTVSCYFVPWGRRSGRLEGEGDLVGGWGSSIGGWASAVSPSYGGMSERLCL